MPQNIILHRLCKATRVMFAVKKTLFAIAVFVILTVDFSHSCSENETPTISLIGNISRAYEGIHFLQYGATLEIFCTASRDKILSASDDKKFTILDTEMINKTTVKYVMENMQKQLLRVTCVLEVDFDCASLLVVVVDNQPDIKDFKCISKNLDLLNCTWTSTNSIASFNLHVMYKEKLSQICATDITQMHCTWTNYDIPLYSRHEKTYEFVMKTCNGLGVCKNTSHVIDHLSTVRLDPPKNLKVVKKNSRMVVVKWEIPYKQYSALNGVDYRIDYWYPGIQPREVNTSSVTNKFTNYQFEIQLPCPDSFYEVQVTMKTKQATNEELWSDFASTSFVTDEDEIEVNNVICEKQRVPLTANIMIYELKKFKKKFIEDHMQVKRKILELKEKSARENEDFI